MPYSDADAITQILSARATAINAWKSLTTPNQTRANWLLLFDAGMEPVVRDAMQRAPSGDPSAAGVPPPPV